jgi:beta-glucosidase
VTGGGGTGVAKMACTAAPTNYPYAPGYQIDPGDLTAAQSKVSSMTLQDRATQLRGNATASSMNWNDIFKTATVAGVNGFTFRDGPRGVNLLAELPGGGQGYSTCFPVPMARGATFDLALEYQIGQAIGDEMVASRHNMMLSPTINILRHPWWGRAQETYGEDAFHLGRLGSAHVVGVQEFVPACAKHYAANNIEAGRFDRNAMMDEQTLHEVYGRHYQMVIQDAGVSCIMAAYNAVNGTKSTQNAHLLNEMLRGEWGFQGFVLTDWWAMPGGQGGQSASAQQTTAAQALKAGLDMELPWSYNFSQLEGLVGSTLTELDITQAATRVVREKYRFKIATGTGLKAATTSMGSGSSIAGNDRHIDLARRAALEGMVLLKNSNNALPIKRDGTVKNIAVIGPNITSNTPGSGGSITTNFATQIRLGDMGSSRVAPDPAKTIGPEAGIRMAGAAAVEGGVTVTASNNASAAASADFVVVVVGLSADDEGEEYTNTSSPERDSFSLDDKHPGQTALITQVAAMGKPMAVVIEGGSVVDLQPWISMLPATSAILMAWYPGQQGGLAMGQMLFGWDGMAAVSPSGKLPITWTTSGWPTFITATMEYLLGYRRFDAMNKTYDPAMGQFPFGYGLSYSKFRYENLQVPCSTVTKNGVVNVQVDVINSGTVPAAEVAFLFVDYKDATVAGAMRSPKELKAFHRTGMIQPGMGARFSFPLRASDLVYYDATAKKMQPVTGKVNVYVGHASQPGVANASHENTTFLTDSFVVN